MYYEFWMLLTSCCHTSLICCKWIIQNWIFFPKRVCFEDHIIYKQEIRVTLSLQMQVSYTVINAFNLFEMLSWCSKSSFFTWTVYIFLKEIFKIRCLACFFKHTWKWGYHDMIQCLVNCRSRFCRHVIANHWITVNVYLNDTQLSSSRHND